MQEPLSDRGKGGAVDQARTEIQQRLLVGRGAVPLVRGEMVSWVAGVHLA